MTGFPVTLSTNGTPIRPVDKNAPVMTIVDTGFGAPITISDNGAPFIVEGDLGPVFDFQGFDMNNGGEGQWVGYSIGGATLPNPPFGSISGEPTQVSQLLALYDDTASGVVLAVFEGDWVVALNGLQLSIGGFVLNSFERELISGNTWVRFSDMPGNWDVGASYQIAFGFDL